MNALPCYTDLAQRDLDQRDAAADRMEKLKEIIDGDASLLSELLMEEFALTKDYPYLAVFLRIGIRAANLWPMFERWSIGQSMDAWQLREVQQASREIRDVDDERKRLVEAEAESKLADNPKGDWRDDPL